MNLLYFTILIPLISFLILACSGRRWRAESVAVIGVSAVGLVLLLSIFVMIDFYANNQPDSSLIYTRYLWSWISVDSFVISISLLLDGLSLVFLLVVILIGFLVHLYAVNYISKQEAYTFFAYGNLLIACMVIVLLADNLFVMLLGWEGITLCSYLLVGFYHKQLKNSYAAARTFIVMHISDIFLLIGLFLVYSELQTLNIRDLLIVAKDKLAIDSEIIFWITFLLFLGAIGKSVQMPLQTWLTDTTAAPMPALTLIHCASTMLVGIYLILRLNSLFMMSTDLFLIIGVLSCLTMLFASCCALVQQDIKRIVIYASLSQISYVFMAISVQAWQLALIYLINYAAFSTLLFLASASVIRACGGERDITKMGGLARRLPFIYFCFIVAGASLSAVPWLTASFFTKGDIIWQTISEGRLGFGTLGLVGVLLSALFVFRLVFLVFHNKSKVETLVPATRLKTIPLFILVLLSTGFLVYLPLPIQGVLPITEVPEDGKFGFQILLAAVTTLGILITYMLYAGKHAEIHEISNSPIGKTLTQFWYHGWRIEWLYHAIFVVPYLYITKRIHKDPLANWNTSITWGIDRINGVIVPLENGHLRWYLASIVGGGVLILLLLVFL
ncbi:NADH-quinone oxidoreductase subunit L [Zophobihabitans entericus]|uniref:NADH-quinone oxidoreductase subunit L n=1 Tax=Zophobihabitans entericus TaxID=1635327 RepID=A0A6G9I9W5_9GAMM|nr:NADH-quinone oxidoreductase subunit L [Zophobihabitans entericus]QIQ20370.1 NADH-quinone oxidoreductase subunit L [Zophobihabitans entericus]